MRIYQADLNLDLILKYHELFPDRKLNVLRSFGRLGREEKDICITHRDKLNSVVLDSGTYTMNYAKALERYITIENYENYLGSFAGDYDFYFNFDEDFTTEGFAINHAHQLRLEKAGFNPVPVVHDIYGDEVEHYIGKGYEMVAIGSLEKGIDGLYLVTDRFFQAGVKVHLFGTARYDHITKLPIFSCDSATGAKTGAYGSILYWNPHKLDVNKTDMIYVEEYHHENEKRKNYISTYEFRHDLETYLAENLGITPEHFHGDNGHFYKRLVNVDFFARLEERVSMQRGE